MGEHAFLTFWGIFIVLMAFYVAVRVEIRNHFIRERLYSHLGEAKVISKRTCEQRRKFCANTAMQCVHTLCNHDVSCLLAAKKELFGIDCMLDNLTNTEKKENGP